MEECPICGERMINYSNEYKSKACCRNGCLTEEIEDNGQYIYSMYKLKIKDRWWGFEAMKNSDAWNYHHEQTMKQSKLYIESLKKVNDSKIIK